MWNFVLDLDSWTLTDVCVIEEKVFSRSETSLWLLVWTVDLHPPGSTLCWSLGREVTVFRLLLLLLKLLNSQAQKPIWCSCNNCAFTLTHFNTKCIVMTQDYLHLRLLVNGFKLALRSKYTLWDNTYHERDEKVFFKQDTFALFGFYDVCASDDQISSLYSSEIKKNWTYATWCKKYSPRWKEKHGLTITQILF